MPQSEYLGATLRYEGLRILRLPDVKPPCLTCRVFGPGNFFVPVPEELPSAIVAPTAHRRFAPRPPNLRLSGTMPHGERGRDRCSRAPSAILLGRNTASGRTSKYRP